MTGIIDPQSSGDLLWRPADHQFVFHVLSQGIIIQASGTPAGLTPFFVPCLSRLAVTVAARGFVSVDFPADGAGTSPQGPGDWSD
jgi:hypothetical protein